MNVELKFKPGVRTSFNSNTSIRDNFSSDKGASGATQARNSTATSAAANLTTMQRATGSWNSNTGSILNGNAPVRTMNSVSSHSAATSRTSPQQGTQRSENYVSAGRTTEYVRPKTLQYQDFGYTRASNMTGYNDRAMQRLLDGAYGRGAYATTTPTYTQNSTTTADAVTTATSATSIATDIINLGKTIWDTFSTKDSKASEGGGTGSKSVAKASESTVNNVKRMKGAESSADLGSAITSSKADLETTNATVTDLEQQLKTANDNKETYQTNLTTATTTRDGLKKQVGDLTNTRNSTEQSLDKALDSYNNTKNAYESAPADAPNKQELKEAMDNAKARVDDLQKKINDANAQLKELEPKLQDAENNVKTAQDAVNANNKILQEVPPKLDSAKASADMYKEEIPKQEDRLKKLKEKEDKELEKLNKQVTDLQIECTQLNESGKVDKAKKKEEKLLKVSAEQQALQETVDIRNLDDVVYQGGHEFKSGLDSHGQPIFVIDGKKVTEEEYKQQLGTETT